MCWAATRRCASPRSPTRSRSSDRSCRSTSGIRCFSRSARALPTLGLVTFRRVAHIEGAACQTIARLTTGEAAMLDCEAGEGRAIVLASDLDNRWNDFPLRATFVPFVHETLRYLAGGRSQTARVLVADVPAGVPPTPGFATISRAARASVETRRVAVNVDPRESDLTRMSVDEFQGGGDAIEGGRRVRGAGGGASAGGSSAPVDVRAGADAGGARGREPRGEPHGVTRTMTMGETEGQPPRAPSTPRVPC